MQADGLLVCMCVIAALALFLCESTNRKWMKQMEQKEVMWAAERKDLISRVMAPDLQSYTNSVIKVKNAEKPVEEAKPVEWAG